MIDFRLLELSMDLSTLEIHFNLIEKEIRRGEKASERELQDKRQELNPENEEEWDNLFEDRDFQVQFVLPRVFRNPFLVTLFTVYETAVVEIAKLIQDKQCIQTSLDQRRNLLKNAQMYFRDDLDFQLTKSNKHWQRIKLLYDLRNAIAHASGRVDMMSPTKKQRVLKINGVCEKWGYLVVDKIFLQETFTLVKEELEGLVARFKEWDTEHRKTITEVLK